MPRNIVICSDGTGNTGVKGRGTNVFKLYEAVDVVGHLGGQELCEQVAIYDDGVGTQKLKLMRVLGGAFGFGLARNVRQLYAELARCYEDGDNIYMFGFSRGAFTVRTLAGFICEAGILDTTDVTARQLASQVSDKYREYRKARPAILERLATPITQTFRFFWRSVTKPFRPAEPDKPKYRKARIRFIGVWDTVDAVGFPIPGIAWVWNRAVHRFKFTKSTLPKCVERACHALAIDEERASFEPSLWDHIDGKTEQVWFAGVHSNVGGGYPKQGMSLVTLHWMMAQAEEASKEEGLETPSLRFRSGLREQYRDGQNVKDYLYDSRSGLAIYYRFKPRHISDICKSAAGAPVRVHHSAIERVMGRPRGYAPGNLPESFEVVTTPGEYEANLNLGKFELHERKNTHAAKKKLRPFAGAKGFWVRWRQTVQVGFFIAQIGLVVLAFQNSPVAENLLPGAQMSRSLNVGPGGDTAPNVRRTVRSHRPSNVSKLGRWSMGVAENAVAPIPGDWAEKRIVRPMFAFPRIGLSFLLVFAICYLLGLFGRLRMETINSNRWRHLKLESITENRTE